MFLDFNKGCHIYFQYPQLRVTPGVSGYRRATAPHPRTYSFSRHFWARLARLRRCHDALRRSATVPSGRTGARQSKLLRGPGLGAGVTLAARHAQGTTPSIRQDVDPGCGSRPGYGQGQDLTLFGGAPAALAYMRATALSNRTANRSGATCL